MEIEGTPEDKWFAEELGAYAGFLIDRHKNYDPYPSEIAAVLRQMADYYDSLEEYF